MVTLPVLIEKDLVYHDQFQNSLLHIKKILIFRDVNKIRIISNKTAWKILELLSHKSMYPSQIAKELKIYEQSAYYYIRKLLEIGAISHTSTVNIKGGTARLYSTNFPSFGLEMDWGSSELMLNNPLELKNKNSLNFLKPFVDDNNCFSGLIVVGSPDPHGPNKSSARDGHYAIHLGFYLGNLFKVPESFSVKLDIDAKAEKDLDGNNLVLIGGPGTNIVTAEFNKYFPICFNEKNFWSGLVDQSNKIFNSDNHGLIAKIRNPYNSEKTILVLAGVRSIGTKAAVMALTNFGDKVFANYLGEENWATVVQGFDMNSDGKIDHVDIVS